MCHCRICCRYAGHALTTYPVCLYAQIQLHDVGGLWVFVAACVGVGVLWHLLTWLVVQLSTRFTQQSLPVSGVRHSKDSKLPTPLEDAVTVDEHIQAVQTRMDRVRKRAHGWGACSLCIYRMGRQRQKWQINCRVCVMLSLLDACNPAVQVHALAWLPVPAIADSSTAAGAAHSLRRIPGHAAG